MVTKTKPKVEKKAEPKGKAKPASKPVAKTAVKPASKPAAKAAAKAAAKPAAAPKTKSGASMARLKQMARDLNVKGASKMIREELIHAIQVAEGHAACYGRIPDCGQTDCLFRPDCLPA